MEEVDIHYASKDLERLCEDEREAKRQLGRPGCRKLRARLADLKAASRVTELVAGRPHELRGDRAGQFALELDRGRRLVLEPASTPIPRKDDGGVALGQLLRPFELFG